MTTEIDWTIERKIIALLHDFTWRVDYGSAADKAGLADLFTEDAIIEIPQMKLSGREEIRSKLGVNPSRITQHVLTNFRITPQADGQYLVNSYALNLSGPAPRPAGATRLAAGLMTDVVVIRDGEALFASRRLDLSFEANVERAVMPV